MEFSSVPALVNWLESDDVTAVATRAFVGFVAAWALFKVGKKRFLKRGSAFDALIVIMVGAVLGRGIAEGDGFLATLLAGAVIMATHWLFALVAHEAPFWSRIIEGHERCLMHDGVLDRRQMGRALVSEADIVQALRMQTGESDLQRVEAAWQEKSGDISLKLKAAP